MRKRLRMRECKLTGGDRRRRGAEREKKERRAQAAQEMVLRHCQGY